MYGDTDQEVVVFTALTALGTGPITTWQGEQPRRRLEAWGPAATARWLTSVTLTIRYPENHPDAARHLGPAAAAATCGRAFQLAAFPD